MNKYSHMQKTFYDKNAPNMAKQNHMHHNDNSDYWDVLLGDVKQDPSRWENLKALDFGCGCGRNVLSLHQLANWASADGCDISENNIKQSRLFLDREGIDPSKSALFTTAGTGLDGMESNYYDFLMSTIVLQHICVYDIRFSILTDMYRVLKEGGLLSVQFPFGDGHPTTRDYYDNYYDAKGTNSTVDVRVDSPSQVVDDLTKVGFKNISHEIKPSYADRHNRWLYVKATK